MLSVSPTALLASPAKVIYNNFSIVKGPMTIAHAITAHVSPRMANLYDGYSVAQNIITASTDH